MLEDCHLGWVEEYIGSKSVTELEILHGVLRLDQNDQRDPDLPGRSFFYFRNDGYHDRHWDAIVRYHSRIDPPLVADDFTNASSSDSQADASKQADLKRRIYDVSFARDPKSYETPSDLASLVLADLWTSIDRIFPASSVPDALERGSLEHCVFMESRSAAYVEREGLFDKLNAFTDEPVEVSAESRDSAGADSQSDRPTSLTKLDQPHSRKLRGCLRTIIRCGLILGHTPTEWQGSFLQPNLFYPFASFPQDDCEIK